MSPLLLCVKIKQKQKFKLRENRKCKVSPLFLLFQCQHFKIIEQNGESVNQSVPIVLPVDTNRKERHANASALALRHEGRAVAILRRPEFFAHRKEERFEISIFPFPLRKINLQIRQMLQRIRDERSGSSSRENDPRVG